MNKLKNIGIENVPSEVSSDVHSLNTRPPVHPHRSDQYLLSTRPNCIQNTPNEDSDQTANAETDLNLTGCTCPCRVFLLENLTPTHRSR